uniref:Uncharacterized protein n=1 Tax=Lepeophtheirus salmonis TaxID=72036 RepID=A0A0K2UFG3_LEPSM
MDWGRVLLEGVTSASSTFVHPWLDHVQVDLFLHLWLVLEAVGLYDVTLTTNDTQDRHCGWVLRLEHHRDFRRLFKYTSIILATSFQFLFLSIVNIFSSEKNCKCPPVKQDLLAPSLSGEH